MGETDFQSHNPGIHGSNKVWILGPGASKADVSLRTLANATLALVDGIVLNVSHAHDDGDDDAWQLHLWKNHLRRDQSDDRQKDKDKEKDNDKNKDQLENPTP